MKNYSVSINREEIITKFTAEPNRSALVERLLAEYYSGSWLEKEETRLEAELAIIRNRLVTARDNAATEKDSVAMFAKEIRDTFVKLRRDRNTDDQNTEWLTARGAKDPGAVLAILKGAGTNIKKKKVVR
jgi:hypothetical protein